MKLLIATPLYDTDIGGPATYTKFLERHLPRHGITLTVVPFTTVRMYPRFVRHGLYILKLLWKAKECDVLYVLDTVSVGVPAFIVSVLLRKKLFLRVPGDYAWEQGQQRFGVTETLDEFLVSKRKPYVVRILSWLQYCVARRAARIVVPSEYMKRVVGAWGISEKKIIRIYSALAPIEIEEDREHLRARFGYDSFTVVTSARLVPWKGVAALIRVCAELRKNNHAIRLEIIGDGPLRQTLQAQIEASGADAYIVIRGKLLKKELGERVKASDAFVLNTSYEGLSHQLLEVMDIGTPIITTPVGGNCELITHEKEGLLVPFNTHHALENALERLMVDSALRERLARNARDKVAQFREDNVIVEVVKLFR